MHCGQNKNFLNELLLGTGSQYSQSLVPILSHQSQTAHLASSKRDKSGILVPNPHDFVTHTWRTKIDIVRDIFMGDGHDATGHMHEG